MPLIHARDNLDFTESPRDNLDFMESPRYNLDFTESPMDNLDFAESPRDNLEFMESHEEVQIDFGICHTSLACITDLYCLSVTKSITIILYYSNFI